MTRPDDIPPGGTSDKIPGKAEKAEAARQERLAREAAALRENLRRRKQQSRARADLPAPRAEDEKS